MVLATYKYQQSQKKDTTSIQQMKLLFDANGNIDMMRVVRKQQKKSEYLKFCGNSQYVPPELSIQEDYSSDLADVWVLGIFLYRMLIGRYPFIVHNDKQLFQKMLYGDFFIPAKQTSSEAVDLLSSMLAPNTTRITLELIIYHPWLLPYRPLLLDQIYNNTPSSPGYDNHQQSPTSSSIHFNSSYHHDQKKKKRLFSKFFLFIAKGPFPPPK